MTTATLAMIVIAIVVVGTIAWAVDRARRSRDGVDSFRRQIDALSPEARRTVVDQVQNAAERREQRDGDQRDDGHEDGARGA